MFAMMRARCPHTNMRACMHTHMYVCLYVYACIHTHTYACVCMHVTCAHVRMRHACIHAPMPAYQDACVYASPPRPYTAAAAAGYIRHASKHVCIHPPFPCPPATDTHTNPSIHTYILTYIHTYIDTCMHAYVHTYIHTSS